MEKSHVLTLGLMVTFSSFSLGQLTSQNKTSNSAFPSSTPERLQLAMAKSTPGQEVGTEPNNKQPSKQGKKARKQQKKEEKKRRKQEAKERKKELKKQEKQIAKQREKELKKENKQIAKEQRKERKREQKEQSKALKKGAEQPRGQSAAPAPPPPSVNADRERQNAPRTQATNSPPPRPSEGSDRYREREREQIRREYRNHTRAIPVSAAVAPATLAAQRNVSRAIYSEIPNSNVIVLVNNSNQIVLRGSAPTPSFRHRLLQLASAAAGGYSIVDQLASDAVSSAAGAATSAAIGGVSDLIHRPSSDSGPDTSGGPPYTDQGPPYGSAYPSNGSSEPYGTSGPDTSGGPPYNGEPGPPYGPPSSDTASGSPNGSNAPSGLAPGSRGCVNVYNDSQVFLTGETSSQADAERMRQLARELGGRNAIFVDQLGTRANGTNSSMPATENTPGSAGARPSSPMGPPSDSAIVTPGSVVCIDANNNHEVLLTGTVGSPAEFAKVEESVQPLLGGDSLIDELTTGTIEVGAQTSGTGGTSGVATTGGARETGSAASNGAIGSPSRQGSSGASGATLPISQSEVEQALHSFPSLSNVDAEVTANSVRLSGSADSADDKQMARDIARQYAPRRDVIDDVTISGRGSDTSR